MNPSLPHRLNDWLVFRLHSRTQHRHYLLDLSFRAAKVGWHLNRQLISDTNIYKYKDIYPLLGIEKV